MFSPVQGSIWDRIKIKNSQLNNSRAQSSMTVPGTVSEWDLSQVDLRGGEEEDGSRKPIPTIELEDDDDEDDLESASVRGEEPLRGFPSAHRIHVVPVQMEASSPVMVGDAHSRSLVRRSIHEYRPLDESLPGESFQMHSSSATAGIIVNRSYNKKPGNPLRDNYFSSSVLDTPPSPGMLPVASIFGESRPTSTEPRIVMTANHYEKRIIRRSVEKPSSTTTATTASSGSSSRERRREKNNAPYKLLGVIDLEPDSETESADTYPDGPSCLDNTTTTTVMESFVSRKVLNSPEVAATPRVTSSSDLVPATTTNGEGKVLTIEIDEDEEAFDEEDTRMELSEAEDEPALIPEGCEADKEVEVDEQCTLSDSDSSTAQVNPSSLANSFWDVSSSGCNKQPGCERSGSSRANKETEFDLLLDRINQQVPAMSQHDRIEHWRVTKEDLLYSIPTVAEIDSGKPAKRPMDGPIHISSSESSTDSETSASPSLLAAKQQRASIKKRRTGEELATGERSSPSLHLSEELDFRRSQINPEIDKISMIQCRKNYHKFPTRFHRATNENEEANRPQDPYVELMSRKDSESDKFATYLRRNNPAYRPDLKALQQRGLTDNKVAVVVLSPLSLQTAETSPQPQPERRRSDDRVSQRYGKERKLRYKVRKPRNKKKIVVVASNLRSSYRRLIMKQSSLRNGKIRKKASFVSLLSAKKKKSRTPELKPELVVARTRARVSVDSAVSSSTSAEHKKRVETAVVPNELRTMKNPLVRANGEVLAVYYFVDKLVVVQQELVSFWGCSKLAALLGLSQELRLLGQCKRAQTDSDVDPTNSQRLGFNENEPFYLEPRARNLDEDDARTCPLASMYVNCYYLADDDEGEDGDKADEEDGSGLVLRMKSLQLDSVRSEISDILFMPLPRSRYFMLCWHEQLSESDYRTGLCKYSLTPDLETLASIREFPSVTQKVTGLRCTDDKLIGLGATTIAIWNTVNGCLVFTVDLKMDIQVPLATYVHTENDESALFVVHLCPSPSGNSHRKLVKVLGINMGKRSWHLVHSYEVALESQSILCESSTLNAASLHCATFASGELLALSLDDLTTCVTNHQRLQGPDGRRVTRDCVAAREKIFLHPAEPRQLVLVSEKFIKLKTVDEYLLACR
ncbi:uncharacterized protein LOC120428319 [Culex pipiens pallens]|uniref:uncharacterized protein LOC120428319 n=1 Tax=Culex pipiens pallens TaxID=42434 RepID=UPI0019539E2E|nr:uncharacterized protein LOC120428319 [Culex pipiens pallens]